MNRRNLLAGAGAVSLGACEPLTNNMGVNRALQSAEALTHAAQKLVTARTALAPEFGEADISPEFRANGSTNPPDADYQAMAATGFADYRLRFGGLVERPFSLSLAELREQPARTQITRHDCVEGWSNIGKWGGARLAPLLDRAGLRAEAKYIVFRCADTLGPANSPEKGKYYESVDLIDARHPQTILAYDMNDAPLTVPYGAPVRVRLERQLGYKMAKYVTAIEAVASYAEIGMGRGGFWEDRGYQWYAGI